MSDMKLNAALLHTFAKESFDTFGSIIEVNQGG
jgi:hypothetical protein